MIKKRTLYSGTGLVLLGVLFIAFIVINNMTFRGVRADLTEGGLYTVSEGSRNIIDAIEEPINLSFFFSDKATRGMTSLRDYALRVRELLEEFEIHGDGRINLSVIDPAPFSEEEDQAAAFGLHGVPVDLGGGDVYFGLVGTSPAGGQEVIPFFQPDQEEFLEYEISKLIHNLGKPEKPVIGLLTDLDISGGFDVVRRQPLPAWIVIEQIKQLFEVRKLEPDMESIDEEIDILLVVHPKVVGESALYAIDQFVLKGGRALVFVDPHSDQDQPQSAQNPMALPGRSSQLEPLFSAWGVRMPEEFVLADASTALLVNVGEKVVRHLALLGITQDQMLADDVVTGGLERVNFSSTGVLELLDERTTEVTPLIRSSELSMLIDKGRLDFLPDPEDLHRGFAPDDEVHTIAVRVRGKAQTAYPDGIEGRGDQVMEADDVNLIVVADTDLLSDRLWVQVQDFFGQRVATPWADNAGFVINALENLGGSADLISLRTRGKFTRPFHVVDELKRRAEADFRDSEKRLQQQLEETEAKLRELQESGGDALVLTPEQEDAILRFQQEKLKIRKELRNVRHNLEKDIDRLGTVLKIVNIVLMPVAITLFALGISLGRARRRRALVAAEAGAKS